MKKKDIKNNNKKYVPKKEETGAKKEDSAVKNSEVLKNGVNLKDEKMDASLNGEQKVKKGFKKKHLVIILASLFLILFTWRIFSFFSKYHYRAIDRSDIGINEELFKGELDEITNIALLGVDSNNVSDSIIIASLNPTKSQPTIKLISIARDTFCDIYPKNKNSYKTKINEAYGNGGEETTLRTLNKNFNLNIKNFISIEMAGFAKIIDKLGGVDITITEGERDQINGILRTTKELDDLTDSYVEDVGNVHLNGAQTVAFVRARKTPTKDGKNDDFGRCDRQKEVLSKLFEKVKSSSKGKILSLVEPSLKYMTTSFKMKEIFKLCKDVLGRRYKLEETSVPSLSFPTNALNLNHNIFRDGSLKSTILYDLKYAGNMINAYIYKDIPPDEFIKTNTPPAVEFKSSDGLEQQIQKNNNSKNADSKNTDEKRKQVFNAPKKNEIKVPPKIKKEENNALIQPKKENQKQQKQNSKPSQNSKFSKEQKQQVNDKKPTYNKQNSNNKQNSKNSAGVKKEGGAKKNKKTSN